MVAQAPAAQITTAPAGPIELDPFFEVRTPARNYGPARLPGGRRVTPLARRLAAEGGVDLAKISPSGPHGRNFSRVADAATRLAATAAAPSPTSIAPPSPLSPEP